MSFKGEEIHLAAGRVIVLLHSASDDPPLILWLGGTDQAIPPVLPWMHGALRVESARCRDFALERGNGAPRFKLEPSDLR